MQHITDRVVVSIRRHRLLTVTLDDLVGLGALSEAMAGLFAALVAARRNIVVCGGPAVGKTTFLRALAHAIPPQERLVTVEDSYELALDRAAHPNLVAMQAREANLEGVGEFSLDQCVRASLRLSPDRVIVGEVRGPEVVTMAKAMSIGMDGSLATVHASSSRQALLRLVTYAMEPPASYPREAARRGNNDAIDAEAAARKVLAGECTTTTTGIVELVASLSRLLDPAAAAALSIPAGMTFSQARSIGGDRVERTPGGAGWVCRTWAWPARPRGRVAPARPGRWAIRG
jgi:Flp pilus assembly CpaF family ATPase